MNPSDMLRQARTSGYGAKSEGTGSARSFSLTPEEVKAVGEDATCVKAYGNFQDGKFMVDRIEPDDSQPNSDEVMVKNPTQLSPS